MKRILIFLMLIFPIFVSSQNTMYFMDRMPQSVFYNPAFIPEVNFYIGLPGLGGASANVYNSGFNYNELNDFIDNLGNEGYSPDKFVKSIGDYNKFSSEVKANILSLGFKIKEKSFFTFGLSINSVLSVKANSEIAYLLANRDKILSGDFPITVDNIDFLTNNYFNLSFTYSRKINEHLTLGISPNINLNLIGAKANKMSYIVNLDNSLPESRSYNNTISGELLLGLPIKINPDAINGDEFDFDKSPLPDNWGEDLSFSDLFRNKSLALSMGATYELDKWIFSASILNLGANGWQNNAYQLNGNNDVVKVKEVNKVKVGIPTKIYIGACRQFTDKWNYGLVLNNTSNNWGSGSSATISLNGYVGKMLSTSVSYTAGYTFTNIGFGLRMRFLPGADLFVVTDNLIQSFGYRKATQLSAAFGINLSFGIKKLEIL